MQSFYESFSYFLSQHSYSEVYFKFHGIVGSSFGDLVALPMTAPLWENKQMDGGHMHINFELFVPLGKEDLVLGKVYVEVKAQVYGVINGQPDAGKLLSGLMLGDGSSPMNTRFMNLVNPQDMKLQIAADAKIEIEITPHTILKLKGVEPPPITISLGGVSTMLEWNYVKGQDENTWIDYRISVSIVPHFISSPTLSLMPTLLLLFSKGKERR